MRPATPMRPLSLERQALVVAHMESARRLADAFVGTRHSMKEYREDAHAQAYLALVKAAAVWDGERHFPALLSTSVWMHLRTTLRKVGIVYTPHRRWHRGLRISSVSLSAPLHADGETQLQDVLPCTGPGPDAGLHVRDEGRTAAAVEAHLVQLELARRAQRSKRGRPNATSAEAYVRWWRRVQSGEATTPQVAAEYGVHRSAVWLVVQRIQQQAEAWAASTREEAT